MPFISCKAYFRNLLLVSGLGFTMSLGLITSAQAANESVDLVLESPATIGLGEEVELFIQADQFPRDTEPKQCVFTSSDGYRQVATATLYFDPDSMVPDIQDQFHPIHTQPRIFIPTSLGQVTYRLGCGYAYLAEENLLYDEVTVNVIANGKCTGLEPWLVTSGIEIYPTDSIDVLADTSWIYSVADTARKCEWHCGPNHVPGQDQLGNFACIEASSGPPPSVSEVSYISLTTNPQYIEPGETTKLSWITQGAVSCQIKADQDSNLASWVDVPVNGSMTSQPTASGAYNMLCVDSKGVGAITSNYGPHFSAYVNVGFYPQILDFYAEPLSLQTVGETTTLFWSIKNGTNCRLEENTRNDGQLGNNAVLFVAKDNSPQTGSRVVAPKATTTYIFFCQRQDGAYGFGPKETVQVTIGSGDTPPPLPPGSPAPGNPPTDNSKCDVGTPKASCNDATEQVVGRTKDGTGVCCLARTGSEAVLYTIPISNPLAFNTVDEILTSLLGFLQAIIVILSLIMIVIGSIVYMTAGGNDSKLSTGKLIITAALIGLALALAAPSFLKEIGAILGWGAVDGSPADSAKSITEILTGILNFLLSVIGIIGIIMLVIGGLMYLTATGDEDRINTGKSIVKYSLIGITVALAALVIISQITKFFGG